MSEQPIDADLKARVLAALAAGVSDDARTDEADVDEQHDASEVITEDTVAFDDTAQSSEELGIAAPLAAAAVEEAAKAQRIEDLDPAPVERVGVGALVGFDGDRYVAGVVAAPFEVDGITYEGLSADAPLYAAVEGLRAGDGFVFRGSEHTIDFVV